MQQSPLTIYHTRIEQGELKPDAAQYHAIKQLDSLFYQLITKQDAGNWFQRLFKSDMFKGMLKLNPFKPPKTPIQGYYFWGGVGTGKTVLMDVFYQSLPAGFGERIHFHRFMQFVHDRKHEIKDRQNPLDIIAASFATRIKVLCLDEFSVTDITDAMILSALLRHFFSHGVVLVTTSNTEIPQLYRDGLQRQRFLPAIALLEKYTIAVQVDSGNDYRMACLQDGAIFHTPVGQQADLALAKFFNQLTGKQRADKTAERTIPILGRDIPIIATDSGVVWFEFQSLCQSHRSKLDYIEIAKQFHTVLLSNISQLTAMRDDAARRLIEMVDEFYDRHVNLIVSSVHPPERIYSGKRLAQPFKRTASRLTEMSTHGYLAKPHLS